MAEEKELKKMNRVELIEIIYALQKSEEGLKQENAKLQEELADRTVRIAEAGSIAEAVVNLNDIFQKAQDTADQYIASVHAAQRGAKETAEKLLSEAQIKSESMVREAEYRKKFLEEEAERNVAEKWAIFNSKVNEILSAHSVIKDLLDGR